MKENILFIYFATKIHNLLQNSYESYTFTKYQLAYAITSPF